MAAQLTDGTTGGQSGAGVALAWVLGCVILLGLTLLVPLLAPVAIVALIGGGTLLRTRPGPAHTVGTILLVAGTLLAIATLVVLLLGMSVEGGESST